MTSLQFSHVDLRRSKFVWIINTESNILFLMERRVDAKFHLTVEKPIAGTV